MGQCCGNNELKFESEDFVTRILSEQTFTLNSLTYIQILNLIADRRSTVDNVISKTEFENLCPKFYSSKAPTNLKQYYKSILEEMLLQFPENKIPLYKIILFLFPLMSHDGEEPESTLYEIVNFAYNKNLSLTNLKEFLFEYIYFCTFVINHSIWKKCESPEIASYLDETSTSLFSKQNIQILADRIMKYIEKIGGSNNVTSHIFFQIFQKWNLTSAISVREFVYTEFY